ncbi:MAG TPA: triphosphoribosyl-dephospho-CoA synthase [Pirellulales bacterium]|nr:triphosphoribosyl-dephospho-CoA synthase [Pirellulales bacterium]
MPDSPLSIGQCATYAALFEAMAHKPGNVHRGSDFEDLTFADLATSAVAIGPVFERAAEQRLGPLVRAAIQATWRVVSTNTNLGMVLLMGPLALVPRELPLARGIGRVLRALDRDDARLVYEAIRLAKPGGMGHVEDCDIAGPAPDDLLAAMQLAADRDLIARQYTNDFADVLSIAERLAACLQQDWSLNDAIVRVHLLTLREHPDSLIVRKCGIEIAKQAAQYASETLRSGNPGDDAYHEALADLDFWLRADGHRRNPGTTADLIAGGLFVALREGMIPWPVHFYPRAR